MCHSHLGKFHIYIHSVSQIKCTLLCYCELKAYDSGPLQSEVDWFLCVRLVHGVAFLLTFLLSSYHLVGWWKFENDKIVIARGNRSMHWRSRLWIWCFASANSVESCKLWSSILLVSLINLWGCMVLFLANTLTVRGKYCVCLQFWFLIFLFGGVYHAYLVIGNHFLQNIWLPWKNFSFQCSNIFLLIFLWFMRKVFWSRIFSSTSILSFFVCVCVF